MSLQLIARTSNNGQEAGFMKSATCRTALPVTPAENRLFGDASDEIKNRAQEISSEGLQVATAAAQDVYHETVSRAQEQGLSADVVRQAVKDVGEKVRGVVEQASEALDKNSSSGSPLQK
jgi:hypothetical protein